MKAKFSHLLSLVAIVLTMNSCSSDSVESTSNVSVYKNVATYAYDETEIQTMDKINSYRASIGLNQLKIIDYLSYKSEEHDNYMIDNNLVNHNNFVARSNNIIEVLGAKSVSENIAYNYTSPQGVLNAWLNSPAHKQNIEGNFTHFGIAVKTNSEGKKYYTNIFIKI